MNVVAYVLDHDVTTDAPSTVAPAYRPVPLPRPGLARPSGRSDYPSLLNPTTSRSLIHDWMRMERPEGGAIDVDSVVDQLTRLEPLDELPTSDRRRASATVDVLIEAELMIGPHRDDVLDLLDRIRLLVPAPEPRVLGFRDDPRRGAGAGPVWTWRAPPQLRPDAAAIVFAGSTRTIDGGAARATKIAAWAADSARDGRPVQLTWIGAGPDEVRGARYDWHVLDDPAPRTPPHAAPDVGALLDALRDAAPGSDTELLALATVVAPLPLVPYATVRVARRAMFPHRGAALEAALCQSPLVEAVTVDGIVIDADVRRWLLEWASTFVSEHPTVAPWFTYVAGAHVDQLSPLLQLEGEIGLAYAIGEDAAATAQRVLSDIAHTVCFEERTRALTWFAGASRRLPASLLDSAAASILGHLARRVGLDLPVRPMPPVAPVDHALLERAIEMLPDSVLGIRREGGSLTLGPVSRSRNVGILVPDTYPRVVRMIDRGASDGGTDVRIPPGSTVALPISDDQLELLDLRGRRWTLAPLVDGSDPPEREAAAAALAAAEEAWIEQRSLPATVTRLVPPGRGVIADLRPAGMPLTAFIPASKALIAPFSFDGLSRLVGKAIDIRLINVDSHSQRVIGERVVLPWDAGTLEVGDVFEGTIVNVVNFGYFVDCAEAAGLEGTRRVNGLLHISQVPRAGASRPTHTRELDLAVGDVVQVRVLEVDRSRERITLSMNDAPPPMLPAVGDRITSEVSKVVPFGYFIPWHEMHDGLLHVSETPEDVALEVGDRIVVEVLSVEAERLRVGFRFVGRAP